MAGPRPQHTTPLSAQRAPCWTFRDLGACGGYRMRACGMYDDRRPAETLRPRQGGLRSVEGLTTLPPPALRKYSRSIEAARCSTGMPLGGTGPAVSRQT